MTNANNGTDILIQKIDEILSEATLDPKDALRLVLASSRAVLSQVKESQKRIEENTKKIGIMWPAYRITVYLASLLAVSVVALLWALATGQAAIVIK